VGGCISPDVMPCSPHSCWTYSLNVPSSNAATEANLPTNPSKHTRTLLFLCKRVNILRIIVEIGNREIFPEVCHLSQRTQRCLANARNILCIGFTIRKDVHPGIASNSGGAHRELCKRKQVHVFCIYVCHFFSSQF
jgi:hypothetical protein